MTIAEALKLKPDKFFKNAEILTGIWEMLGKGPPWKHRWVCNGISVGGQYRPYKCRGCCRCKIAETDKLKFGIEPGTTNSCPVPPPLRMEPEVVAERLKDTVTDKEAFQYAKLDVVLRVYPKRGWDRDQAGTWYGDTHACHRILVALVAGGKVSE